MPETAIETLVVGSHTGERQGFLRRRHKEQGEKIPMVAALEREPANEHDENAIAVHLGTLTPDGQVCLVPTHVGYIPRHQAAELAPRMDAGEEIQIKRCRIIRDWSKGFPTHQVKLVLRVHENQEALYKPHPDF